MQWLINIVKEWVETEGYLTEAFVNRGDPADNDFSLPNFIADGNYHDLDLSGIVPAGATAVSLDCALLANAVSAQIFLRTDGNVEVANEAHANTHTAMSVAVADLLVPLTASRIIEYKLNDVTWFAVDLTVKGWWL